MGAGTFLRSLKGSQHGVVEAGPESVTLRYATPDDAQPLARLAAIDSSRAPRGVVLLAQVDEELWAAISLDDGHGVADPFRPTASVRVLLEQRARQLRHDEKGRMGRLPRVWPALEDERLGLAA